MLEGSALLPERFADAGLDDVTACWLTADSDLLEQRIHASSRFDRSTPDEQALIQKFVQRNHRYGDLMMDVVNKHRLSSIDVGAVSSADDLTERCIGLLDA